MLRKVYPLRQVVLRELHPHSINAIFHIAQNNHNHNPAVEITHDLCYIGGRNRVGEFLKTWLEKRRFMEVEIENVKVAIKL